MLCGALAIPGNVSKTEGSSGRQRDHTVLGGSEEAVTGGDVSNDDGACSRASAGTGAMLRSSRVESRSPKFVSVRVIDSIRGVAKHTMIMSI